MAGKNPAVFGIYPTHASLEVGVYALKGAGFRHSAISILYPEDLGIKNPGEKKATNAPEGAATGATTGALVGGALGWLAGIGSLAIPGAGLFIAAGPIISALAGASAAGVVGGIAGGLVGLGVAEGKASHFQDRIRDGGTLLSIHSDNAYWAKRAREILERTGAQDITTSGEVGATFGESDQSIARGA
jgi:hypothetical protein